MCGYLPGNRTLNRFTIKALCIIPQAPLYTMPIRKLCITMLYTIAKKKQKSGRKGSSQS